MKTTDFIKRYCIGTTCPNFDCLDGCHAYIGEECDAAFNHQSWHGLKMVDRVNMLCENRCKNTLKVKNVDKKRRITSKERNKYMCMDDFLDKLHAILDKYGIDGNRMDEICGEIYYEVVKEAYNAGFDDGKDPKTFWND